MKKVIFLSMAALAVTLAGCKHDVTSGNPAELGFDDPSFGLALDESTALDQLISSKHFTGTIEVGFKSEEEIHLSNGKFSAKSSNITQTLNQLIAKHPGMEVRRAFWTVSEPELKANHRRIARDYNAVTSDPNSYYHFIFQTAADAKSFIKLIKLIKGVRFAEPQTRRYLTSMDIPQDPLLGDQTYMAADNNGLNIESAWQKAKGEGVRLFDIEGNWNFNHEDLAIDKIEDMVAKSDVGCISFDNPKACLKNEAAIAQHGTAMVGILTGVWNTKGISGIAPESDITLMQDGGGSPSGVIVDLVAQFDMQQKSSAQATTTWSIREGDIVLIVSAYAGAKFAKEGCGTNSDGSPYFGCLPIESTIDGYDQIQNVTELGAVVVEGAANGGVNLDTSDGNYSYGPGKPFYSDPANDSGAIMVGSIDPFTGTRAITSNCGSRVNVHAWGANVTTTKYAGNYDVSNPPPIVNSSYDKSGGTSSASAIVAGVASLVQSFTKKMYADGSTYTDPGYGTFEKRAYFDSKQMRAILEATGYDSGQNGDCPIGVLPDAAAAIAAVESGEFVPTIKIKLNGKDLVKYNWSETEIATVNPPWRGKKYDVDGDNRSDLVRWELDQWVIDLSSVGTTEDKFGSDDVTFPVDNSAFSTLLFPVVADYNGDGKADLALYDSLTGKYYLKYSTESVMASPQGAAIQWDKLLDYSTFANWKPFARPVPGYYNADDWLDIAFQGPQDTWWIDYGKWEYPTDLTTTQYTVFFQNGDIKGPLVVSKKEINELIGAITDYLGQHDEDDTAAFDDVVTYLSPELYSQAPGWAFLGTLADDLILFKHPDSIPTAGQIYIKYYWISDDTFYDVIKKDAPEFVGNETILVPAVFNSPPYGGYEGPGFKNNAGDWGHLKLVEGSWISDPLEVFSENFGGINCRPIPGDYDGDDYDDAAVQCNTAGKWKIAYSDDLYAGLIGSSGFREVGFNSSPWTLPGCTFPGGIEYQKVQELYTTYKTKIENEWEKDCAYEFGTPTCPFDIQYPEFGKPTIWPPPIGPFFAQCVAEQPKYAPNLPYCWDK